MIKNALVLFIFLSCHVSSLSHAEGAAQTTYPFVLIHGLYGYSKLSFSSNYWGNIPNVLRSNGATVYLADVSQAQKIDTRGEQLYRQLKEYGHEKYNLIGHSHGGLDARYVLENYPDIVASVTTIGTPHHGSKVADTLSAILSNHHFTASIVLTMGDLLGHTIGALSGTFSHQDSYGALQGLTTEGLEQWNQDHPIGLGTEYCEDGPASHNGIRLYSWGSYITDTDVFPDILSKLMLVASFSFDQEERNDGLVAVCSMKFGRWLGAKRGAHHLAPVGGVMSRIPDEQKVWSQSMFLIHAERLRSYGL